MTRNKAVFETRFLENISYFQYYHLNTLVMKKLLFFILIAIAVNASAQNGDYTVTMSGIGSLKIGMNKAALEKVLGKKISLKNLLNEEGYADTIKTKYKAIDVTLYIGRWYLDENKQDIVLSGVWSASTLCKTKSGIAIGDDKIKVINVYENNTLYIWPEYEDDTYTKRSKTKSLINISADDSENNIVVHLVNKKVVAFEVVYYEGE